jgi:peroxin-11B
VKIVNDLAPRLWMIGLLASLAYNIYRAEIHLKISMEEGKIKSYSDLFDLLKDDSVLRNFLLEALQDLLDLVIPLSLSGMIEFSSGTVGLAGTITSLLGSRNLWPI